MPRPTSPGRAVAAYSVARLALFGGLLGLLFLAGLRGLLLLVVATVLSGAVSFLLLARQRAAMAGTVERSVRRRRAVRAGRRAAEDADPDSDRPG